MKVKKALRGVRVQLTHSSYAKIQKILGITSQPASQLMFSDETGLQKSVSDYFLTKYNIRLKYFKWSCLQAGSDTRPIYLPIEVCMIVQGQRYPKKLNESQVTELLRAVCVRPEERQQKITRMVAQNGYNTDEMAMEFDKNTIIFGADVTHPPPGEDLSPSIAAVVASLDWPEVTKANGHQKPSRIIFYRDGVSEGQFSQVLLYEVDAIYKACQSIELNYLPRLTFVVYKRVVVLMVGRIEGGGGRECLYAGYPLKLVSVATAKGAGVHQMFGEMATAYIEDDDAKAGLAFCGSCQPKEFLAILCCCLSTHATPFRSSLT
ncbi:hypothetical protein GIB67_020441 [Kingdonia uniflora]|uniref:Uncharacterized protein n=1 Tax=Kingdonia uniflora TaxID=39325 RepID=A0A7J7LUU6_9MAGN|nr:hypothetical protein GIB67_020441 [Kingdonia uniflora]